MAMTGAFEIQSIDVERKRIGVALLPEGSSPAAALLGDDRAGWRRRRTASISLGDKLRGAIKSSRKT